MTREEAKAAFEGISRPGSFGTMAWIDRFVALGMLKLDNEPKTNWFDECGKAYAKAKDAEERLACVRKSLEWLRDNAGTHPENVQSVAKEALAWIEDQP